MNTSIQGKQNLIKRIIRAKFEAERKGILDSVLESGLNDSIAYIESEIEELKRKEKQAAQKRLVISGMAFCYKEDIPSSPIC